MLENRSFDCLLGKLYDRSVGFEGLSGTEQNPPYDTAIRRQRCGRAGLESARH
jgi:hypothetical protein